MNVVAFGFISVFAKSGEYQLYVENLQPDGIGALHIAFERLKIQLKKKVFFPRTKVANPFIAQEDWFNNFTDWCGNKRFVDYDKKTI